MLGIDSWSLQKILNIWLPDRKTDFCCCCSFKSKRIFKAAIGQSYIPPQNWTQAKPTVFLKKNYRLGI